MPLYRIGSLMEKYHMWMGLSSSVEINLARVCAFRAKVFIPEIV